MRALKDEALETEGGPDPPSTAAAVPPKPPLTTRVIAELKHYYSGFKLLFIDVRVCVRYGVKVLNGKSLNRRERRQVGGATGRAVSTRKFCNAVIMYCAW